MGIKITENVIYTVNMLHISQLFIVHIFIFQTSRSMVLDRFKISFYDRITSLDFTEGDLKRKNYKYITDACTLNMCT